MVLAVAVLTTAAQEAQAVWVEMHLTPKNVTDQAKSFTIQRQYVEGLKEFEGTIEPRRVTSSRSRSPRICAS